MKKFELVFVGSATAKYFPRYRRFHSTIESAQETATAIREKLENRNLPVACHSPIVYGPGCGKDGTLVPALMNNIIRNKGEFIL